MVRKIVLGVGAILVLSLAYNLIRQINDAIHSSERLSIQAETVYQLEAKNKELKNKLSRIQLPEFIEQQARNKLGLGKSGETLVIIPEEKIKQILRASSSAEPVRLPNWLGWWKVFFK